MSDGVAHWDDMLRPEKLSFSDLVQAKAERWNNRERQVVLWSVGARLFAVLLKPPAEVLDVALHCILCVARIFVGATITPLRFVYAKIRGNKLPVTNWTVQLGLRHLGVAIFHAGDFFVSPMVNILSPDIYRENQETGFLGPVVQNLAIKLNKDERAPLRGFLRARLVGVLLKPLADLVDLVAYICFSVKYGICGAVLLPLSFVASVLNREDIEAVFRLQKSLSLGGGALLIAVDLFISPFVNLISPDLYKTKLFAV